MSVNVQALINYYADRLCLQYRALPKAYATIQALVGALVADGIIDQLNSAFDLDTAVGAQLDIIGKYVGVARNIGPAPEEPYFGFWDSTSTLDPAKYKGTWVPATDSPALPAAAGGNNGWWYVISDAGTSSAPIVATWIPGNVIFSNGTIWAKTTAWNGNGLSDATDPLVNRNGIFLQTQFIGNNPSNLSDTIYRLVIKLKIILNHTDMTLASIQSYLHQFFPGQVVVIDNLDMTLTYNVSNNLPLSLDLLEEFLPKPMGVGITVNVV